MDKLSDNESKREFFREHFVHLQSDENLAICKPFITECERLARVAMEYENQCQDLMAKLSKEVATEQFATGGEALHRGYYCPSPIRDIVIGNSNRGKLLSRLTKRSKPTYQYKFDDNGRMILVDNIHYDINSTSTEIILHDVGKELGVVSRIWNGEQMIEQVSEIIYENGKIISYTTGDGYGNTDVPYSIGQYIREEYTYSEKGIETAHIYHFLNHEFAQLLRHFEFRFQHDEEGYLSEYSEIIHPNSSGRTEPVLDGQIYSVRVKRKV